MTSKSKGEYLARSIFKVYLIRGTKLKKWKCMFEHIYFTLDNKFTLQQVMNYFVGTKISKIWNYFQDNLSDFSFEDIFDHVDQILLILVIYVMEKYYTFLMHSQARGAWW